MSCGIRIVKNCRRMILLSFILQSVIKAFRSKLLTVVPCGSAYLRTHGTLLRCQFAVYGSHPMPRTSPERVPGSNFTRFQPLPKLDIMQFFTPESPGLRGSENSQGVFLQTATPQPCDPRLQPTPDYGTLGPDSDIPRPGLAGSSSVQPRNPRLLYLAAMMAGIGFAVAVSTAGGIRSILKLGRPSSMSSHKNSFRNASLSSDVDLDRQQPQRQAEILLERAVTRSHGASDQIETEIESRVETWRGKLKLDSQLGQLTTVALNSPDASVRNSAVEVQLAAYGVAKTDSTVESLIRQADSSNHAQKIWALWTLGLLANRGTQTDRIVSVLGVQLKTSNQGSDKTSEDARRWAVEGLALAGTTSAIAPLLEAMHDDPSPTVRERAACSLAESGMLSHEQRLTAVPQLINYSDDPALDAQTHGWAFQALGDITKQQLPNNSAAWRNWYQNNNPNN